MCVLQVRMQVRVHACERQGGRGSEKKCAYARGWNQSLERTRMLSCTALGALRLCVHVRVWEQGWRVRARVRQAFVATRPGAKKDPRCGLDCSVHGEFQKSCERRCRTKEDTTEQHVSDSPCLAQDVISIDCSSCRGGQGDATHKQDSDMHGRAQYVVEMV